MSHRIVSCLTFEHFVSGMGNREVLDQIDRGFRHPKPKDCPPEMYELMAQCWAKDPEDRPTFEYLAGYLDDFYVSAEEKYNETS